MSTGKMNSKKQQYFKSNVFVVCNVGLVLILIIINCIWMPFKVKKKKVLFSKGATRKTFLNTSFFIKKTRKMQIKLGIIRN